MSRVTTAIYVTIVVLVATLFVLAAFAAHPVAGGAVALGVGGLAALALSTLFEPDGGHT